MYFPKQNIPDEQKDKKWCSEMIDAVIRYHGNSVRTSRERRKDYDNYMLFNGLFDQRQFEYITNTYGLATPARLVNYPIIQPKVDLMVGEFVNQPLKFSVYTVNKDAVSRKLTEKSEIMAEFLLAPVIKEIEEAMGGQETGAGNVPLDAIPEDIEMFFSRSYRENVESMVYHGLNYLNYKYHNKDIFKRGLYDLCITGKTFYKTEIVNGDPRIRRIDPRALLYDNNNDSEYLDDAQWVAEERYMTINEIIDEFRSELTMEDIRKLEDIRQSSQSQIAERYTNPTSWYFQEQGDYGSSTRIKVIHCEWKSIRTMRVKLSPNKFDPDTPFVKILPDNYRPRKNDTIDYRAITDIWEATRIGPDINIRCRRRPNQIRFERDLANTKLSYVGAIRNNIDGSTISIVDSLKNIQLLYNVVMFHIDLAMARAGGKSVVYDTSQAPQGMDFATVMYHVKNSGLIPINSKQEGNQPQTFNQFQQVDFTLSNSVQQLINLKMMLEDTANKITGINNERQGVMKGYEAVGSAERSVFQSSLVTQPLFHIHSKVIEKCMNNLANLMKICWNRKDSMSYILGDNNMQIFDIDESLSYDEYGVFVTSSTTESAKKKVIEGLAANALSSGQVDFLQMIKVVNAESASDAETVLEMAVQEMKKQQQMMQQQQVEAQQAAAEAQQQKTQADMQMAQAANDTKIRVAQINADGAVEKTRVHSESQEDITTSKNKAKINEEFLKNSLGR